MHFLKLSVEIAFPILLPESVICYLTSAYGQSQRLHISFLSTALENQSHFEAYQQALKEGVKIPLKYLKVLFFGPPRTGKTSMRRRLVGEIRNLK